MSDSVIVTGASTGIGLAAAVSLAEYGFNVYATMRNTSSRAALDAEALRRNVELHVHQLDIDDQASIDRCIATVLEESGGIYGLINNAGIGSRGFFEDLSDADIRRVFETNVFGTMAVTRAVLPHMRAAGRGRILVVTSIAGRLGAMGVSAYCATRFAQEGFAESLAQEVSPLGIDVVLIEPGIVKTEHFATDNRGVVEGALDPNSAYYDWFQREEALMDRIVEASPIKVSDVTRAIQKAMTAKRPPLRYLIGRGARIMVTMRRLLPATWFDRLYAWSIHRRVIHDKRR